MMELDGLMQPMEGLKTSMRQPGYINIMVNIICLIPTIMMKIGRTA